MITFQNLIAFVVGFALVYMMFRAMGCICLLAFFLLITPGQAQTNPVLVVNWPYETVDYPVSVPVTITDSNSPNVWPAAASGFGIGLTVCGFGWVLRIVKRTGAYAD
ncbi:MAG: hypothetical protein WDM80_09435 [Limisphaerales bacterium]